MEESKPYIQQVSFHVNSLVFTILYYSQYFMNLQAFQTNSLCNNMFKTRL